MLILFFVIVLGVALSYVCIAMIMTIFAAARAYETKPYSKKYGMVFDTKLNKIIGTTTPVYKDPISGESFLGKTIYHKK